LSLKDSFQNLYKKMDATAKTRFYASRRLMLHTKFSTYTVVIISMAIILIALMQTYGIGENIHTKYASVIQIFSAIAVLVYSLLIDKNEYAATAEKMFACASKVSELKQRMHPLKEMDNPPEDQYSAFQKEYWQILDLYETHSNNDFTGDNIRARLDMTEFYSFSKLERALKHIKVFRLYIFDFASYALVLGVLFWVLKWLWLG